MLKRRSSEDSDGNTHFNFKYEGNENDSLMPEINSKFKSYLENGMEMDCD